MIKPVRTALVMAAVLAAITSSADIRIVLNTHGSAKPLTGKLLLHPASAPQAAGMPVNISGRQAKVRLSNGTWQVRGELAGYFVEPRAFTVATNDETIEVSAWPATEVTGTLKVPEGEKLPDVLELRWTRDQLAFRGRRIFASCRTKRSKKSSVRDGNRSRWRSRLPRRIERGRIAAPCPGTIAFFNERTSSRSTKSSTPNRAR